MRSIARLAGVSPTVVSHVLNRTPSAQVAADTRQTIERLAEETGYQKSLLARAIKNPLRHLGIAIGGPEGSEQTYTDEIFAGIRVEALARQYCPVIQQLPIARGQIDCSAAAQRITELYRAKLVDGYIIDKQFFANESVCSLHEHGVPLVTVNGAPVADSRTGEPLPAVLIDDQEGVRLGMQHLADLGHRRVALIVRPYTCYPTEFAPYRVYQQVLGFRKAVADLGLEFDEELIAEGDPFDRRATYRAVDRILGRKTAPTAILVGDDMMALMVLRALEKRGLDVPADMSVVGYGGWPVATHLADPELTTVNTPLVESGKTATQMIVQVLERGKLEQPQVVLKPMLVVRDSTRKLRR